MTTQREALTNAELDLSLRDKAGKVFNLSFRELSDKDMSELEGWMRQRHIQTAVKAAEGLDVETRRMIVDAAVRQASQISLYNAEGAKILSTFEGIARVIKQVNKGTEISFEKLCELMRIRENVQKFEAAQEQINSRAKVEPPFAKRQRKRSPPKKRKR